MFQYKILEIFERKHKIKMIFIFLFLFLVSVLELLSIGSILPIFTIIFDQQYFSKVNSNIVFGLRKTALLNVVFRSL